MLRHLSFLLKVQRQGYNAAARMIARSRARNSQVPARPHGLSGSFGVQSSRGLSLHGSPTKQQIESLSSATCQSDKNQHTVSGTSDAAASAPSPGSPAPGEATVIVVSEPTEPGTSGGSCRSPTRGQCAVLSSETEEPQVATPSPKGAPQRTSSATTEPAVPTPATVSRSSPTKRRRNRKSRKQRRNAKLQLQNELLQEQNISKPAKLTPGTVESSSASQGAAKTNKLSSTSQQSAKNSTLSIKVRRRDAAAQHITSLLGLRAEIVASPAASPRNEGPAGGVASADEVHGTAPQSDAKADADNHPRIQQADKSAAAAGSKNSGTADYIGDIPQDLELSKPHQTATSHANVGTVSSMQSTPQPRPGPTAWVAPQLMQRGPGWVAVPALNGGQGFAPAMQPAHFMNAQGHAYRDHIAHWQQHQQYWQHHQRMWFGPSQPAHAAHHHMHSSRPPPVHHHQRQEQPSQQLLPQVSTAPSQHNASSEGSSQHLTIGAEEMSTKRSAKQLRSESPQSQPESQDNSEYVGDDDDDVERPDGAGVAAEGGDDGSLNTKARNTTMDDIPENWRYHSGSICPTPLSPESATAMATQLRRQKAEALANLYRFLDTRCSRNQQERTSDTPRIQTVGASQPSTNKKLTRRQSAGKHDVPARRNHQRRRRRRQRS